MSAHNLFKVTGLAAALLAASAPAHAAEPLAPAGLNTAASAASVGVGYATDDARRFGQYNGIDESGAYGLLDFNYATRADDTGTWLGLFGRNVGLDNRQLRVEQSRQGNWGYFLEYSRIPHLDPYSITTAVTGIGTTNLTIPTAPTSGVPVDIKTRRDNFGFGFDKVLSGNWDLHVRFRNEEKDGTRVFARGTTSSGPPGSFGQYEFTPEPINSTTRQLDLRVGYTTTDLQLAGGYYGTMYNNQYLGLDINGGLAGLATFTPLALPPDNQSHQVYLTGAYAFTPTTRGNFKVAYAKAKQDDAFVTGVNVPLSPGIGNNLGGRVDTTLVQGNLTSNPLPKLTLLANFRYENRDDKTPVLLYLTPPPSTSDGGNEPRSIRTTSGKVEASYSLPYAFRVTGGIDYEEKKRNTSPVRIVSYRETTDEVSYRVELRRMMSESVTGSLSYIHSDRDGSPWLLTTQTGGAVGSNLIAPIHLADRNRDKVRLLVNWTPTDPLTFTFFVDSAQDDYSNRDGSSIGPQKGRAQNFSVDAAYTFNDQWQATAWYTRGDIKADQKTCVGAASNGVCGTPTYGATVKNTSDNFGLGFRGRPTAAFEIGADFTYSDIKDEYQQNALIGSPIASLPNVSTKQTRLNLYGKYALQKNSGIRLDYVFDRYSTDDWLWSTWMYADGTRLQDPNQKVNFIGVSYYYKWQ